MIESGLKRRARRAIERQLDYQRRKASALQGSEEAVIADMVGRSAAAHRKLSAFRPLAADARVLEVGSGAHGLIFFFKGRRRVGIDPLADHYRRLFPAWQSKAETITASGEKLPFADASFDVVLCDNVVDHAESPRRIVEEIARVLAPGGVLYFTVNIHHVVYHWAASAHAAWRALGIPFEITPFADHTVHLTERSARRLFAELPFEILSQADDIAEAKRLGRVGPHRHLGDRLKRWFFKNAAYEVIAVRTA